MPDTLTSTQAALKLGCSAETVRRMIKNGALPAHRVTPTTRSHWRIYITDIEELEQRRTLWCAQPQPEPAPTAV